MINNSIATLFLCFSVFGTMSVTLTQTLFNPVTFLGTFFSLLILQSSLLNVSVTNIVPTLIRFIKLVCKFDHFEK